MKSLAGRAETINEGEIKYEKSYINMHEYNNVRLNMKKMMYNFRRTIGIALSLMLVIVLFTACTDSPNDSTSSTDHPQQSETVPITEAPIESQTDSGKADETTVSDAVEAGIVLP